VALFFIRPIIAATASWLALCAAAPAQDYPMRTIRVIIPLGAGGGGDVFTRALADELQKAWGQSVVVENRAGGALNIGTRACAESAPDGYTICILSSEPVIYNQFLFRSLPFDPEKDFEPVTILFFNTLALVVNSSLKVKTIPELVALSKAEPSCVRSRPVRSGRDDDANHSSGRPVNAASSRVTRSEGWPVTGSLRSRSNFSIAAWVSASTMPLGLIWP
jgi:tripartite-type tricarboxylate transporter receptor subunit TctC